MTVLLATTVLDDILAIQLSVAWAGEGRCEPRRLGWWETDLIDPRGGGDLMARLLPRTAAWAGLEAVREAAMRVDRKARAALPDPDKVAARAKLVRPECVQSIGEHWSQRTLESNRLALTEAGA
jgi:hypothetical protein